MLVPRITLITLGVTNLQKSTGFYRDVFGWEPTKDSNEHITFFKVHGLLLALFDAQALAKDAKVAPQGNGFRQFALAHNVSSKKEVDQAFANFKSLGVPISNPPESTDWGGYSGYIQDLDGHLWEIAFNPFLDPTQL